MSEKFNSQTPTIDQTFTKLKTLATRTLLSATLAMGGVATIQQTANPVLAKEQSTLIARSELSNQQKEGFDRVYNKALKLSDHLKIPVNLTSDTDQIYFNMRDYYAPNPQTQEQVTACGARDPKVGLSSFRNQQTGLVKWGMTASRCSLQLPVDFFLQSGDPIQNLQSDYPQVYKEINEKITQFQFTNEQYYQLTTKLVDIVDGNKDKNRKNIRIYVSEEMLYQVES